MWESEIVHGLIGVLGWFLSLGVIGGGIYFATAVVSDREKRILAGVAGAHQGQGRKQ